jgi:hypothetical protein
VLFKNTPIQGDYPHVRFVVTAETAGSCCPNVIGSSFTGKIDDTLDIVVRPVLAPSTVPTRT